MDLTRTDLLWLHTLQSVKTVTGVYSVSNNDDILISTSGSGISVTLPEAHNGRILTFIKKGSGDITLNCIGSDSIHGSSSLVINTQYSPVTIKALANEWIRIG